MPTPTPPETGAIGGDDLSALAWVQGELRRSLEHAHKALRRYVKESDSIGDSDVDAVDPSVLRTARVHIHQGVGALELVGLPAAAHALRASEAAVQRLIARPKLATSAAVETIEHLSHAVIDYLGRLLAGKPVAPLALFPQYAAAQALAGAERVHPADLWSRDWQWRQLPAEQGVPARQPDDDARGEMEYLTLALMRVADPAAQRRMSDLCAELAAGAAGEQATLWQLASAFFQAQAAGLIGADLHTKRVGSRLLASLRAAAKGEPDVSPRLAQDLLFYGVRAELPADPSSVPRLAAVQAVWPGDPSARADYQTARLGLFDPALVLQARKRVASAKDAWSAVCGGELQRLAGLGEAFALLADSVQRLFVGGETLGQALQAAAAQAAAQQRQPGPALAMEVATAILYLDAVLEDGELDQPILAERVQHLAQRIRDVAAGAEARPLEQWMEELYRRVSDRQTMGSVVQELRASLSTVEKQIDQYFRDPTQRELLIPVPAQLSSMRGVLSVLGMDQASAAVLRMRDDVDALAQTEVDPQRAVQTGTFDRLADNLGALSFLIDMLSVQPVLAKTLFRFDPATGNLSAVMGQTERTSAFAAFDDTMVVAESPVPAPAVAAPPPPLPSVSAPVAAPAASGLEDDAEMREIFLEEAREVVADARASMARLAQPGADGLSEITTIRRAFHTLKGSARMVGLKPFGEAAWACEQLYNARLAQNAGMDGALHTFTSEALDYLADWVEAIASGQDRGHAQAAVIAAADALRLEGRQVAIEAPDTGPQDAEPQDAGAGGEEEAPVPDRPVPQSLQVLVPDLPAAADLSFPSIDDALPLPPVAPAESDLALPLPDVPEVQEILEAPAAPETSAPVGSTGDEVEPPFGDLPEAAIEPEALALHEFAPLPSLEALPTLPDDAVPAQETEEDVGAPAVGAAPDFELDLGAFDQAGDEPAAPAPAADIDLPMLELPPVDDLLDAAAPAPDLVLDEATEPEIVELSAADFDLEFALPTEPEPEPEQATDQANEPTLELDLTQGAAPELPAEDAPAPVVEVEPAPAPVASSALEPAGEGPAVADAEPRTDAAEDEDESVKVVGPLRVAIPLFNIFLNEADEQSRRLGTEIAEWTLEPHRPMGDSTIALAHSLAGNSGTVGFADLSMLARALEHALMRSRAVGHASDGEAELFSDAAAEIRRLLHQFAAGFLKPVDAELMLRLADHEIATSNPERDTESPELDDSLMGEFGPMSEPAGLHSLPGSSAAHGLAPRDGTAEPGEEDEDIDAVDAIDRDLFPIFEEEADELLPQLRARLSDWVRQPADAGPPAACMRTLHTFKGGARLA
jgi:chemosensory pili system protein ChpA (sensor histidine kinase/response regulator)